MDEEFILIHIRCYSEQTSDFIGSGVYVTSSQPSAEEIIAAIKEQMDSVMTSFEECFWELLCEFESSVRQAFDKCEITGTDRNELFKVFGHFHFSYIVDGDSINGDSIDIDLGIDPDEYMYSKLVEYLMINDEE